MSHRPEVHAEQVTARDCAAAIVSTSGERLIEADLRLLVALYGDRHPAAAALDFARGMARPVFRYLGRSLTVFESDASGRIVDPLADTVVLPRVTTP